MSKFMVVWEGFTPRSYSSNVALSCAPEDLDKIVNLVGYIVDCSNNKVIHKEILEFDGTVTEKEAQRLVIEWKDWFLENQKRS